MTSFNEMQNEVAPNLPRNSKIHWLINNQSKFCTLPWINLNTNTNGNLNIPGNVSLSNGTTLATGTFDNGTSGNNGISLNCASAMVYELNWQGGHLKSTQDNGATAATIQCDSPIDFPGSGVSNLTINASGITFPDGSIKKSIHPTVIQLGSVSGTINTNASLGDIFDLTLAASGTLANPSGSVDGQTLRWRISHNANSLVLNFGNQFKIPSSATSPLPLSSTSGNMDILGATYDSSRSKWDIIAFVPGY